MTNETTEKAEADEAGETADEAGSSTPTWAEGGKGVVSEWSDGGPGKSPECTNTDCIDGWDWQDVAEAFPVPCRQCWPAEALDAPAPKTSLRERVRRLFDGGRRTS